MRRNEHLAQNSVQIKLDQQNLYLHTHSREMSYIVSHKTANNKKLNTVLQVLLKILPPNSWTFVHQPAHTM